VVSFASVLKLGHEAREAAVALAMSNPENSVNLEAAFRLHGAGKLAEASSIYRAILQRHPDDPNALHYLGVAEAGSGKSDVAKSLMERSLQVQPHNPQFIENYATLLLQVGNCEEALPVCQSGLALNPANAQLLYVQAVALLRLARLLEAIAQFDHVLSLQPNNVVALNERGSALAQIGRFDEALASFAKALALNPRYAEAHFNEALCLLLHGDLARGLEKYEWRWEIASARPHKRNLQQPRWTGREDLAGKTILLYAEQGFGDTIQFCRYVPLLQARGARVILEVQQQLRGLLEAAFEQATVIVKDDPLPNFDMHCPLLSLPLAFETRLNTVPPIATYLRAPSPSIMDQTCDRLRIGLVWSGSLTNINGRNRSMSLTALLPLLKLKAPFVSLQKDVRAEDAKVLRAHSELLHVGDELFNFADTAEKIADLDLVISIDTSVAHLAGSMGKPVWVLLPFVPDWRWLLDREDSPWYPTARLFRQDDSRTWDGVVARLAGALQAFIADDG
jgi:Flp pilus assembly protein TadD